MTPAFGALNLTNVVLRAQSKSVDFNRYRIVNIKFIRICTENRLTPTNTDLVGHRQNGSQNKERFRTILCPVISQEPAVSQQSLLSRSFVI